MKQQPLTSSRAAPCRPTTHDLSSCSQLGDQISAHYHLCRWARPQPVRNNNNIKTNKTSADNYNVAEAEQQLTNGSQCVLRSKL